MPLDLIRVTHARPVWILPAIVTGQVLATSTWFAANAVASDIGRLWPQGESVALITLVVQLGFIAGTLIFALTGISDAMPGRKLFLISALVAAATNGAVLFLPSNLLFVLLCRFCTGIALAGVYPVGMKIAAGWYATGLGRALGFLVGALVIGTSITHLARAMQIGEHWQAVILLSSLAAIIGGGLVFRIPDVPQPRPAKRQALQLEDLRRAMGHPEFKRAALAYFGHMWELYAFWAFMPRWIQTLNLSTAASSFLCFVVIAVGMLGCVFGGLAAERLGSRRIARFFLAVSTTCCLISPAIYGAGPWWLICFLIVWGIAVVGDSPQLSSLNAQSAPRELLGSALTATTCVGFSITVVSLLTLDSLSAHIGQQYLFLPLAVGPAIGWWILRPARP